MTRSKKYYVTRAVKTEINKSVDGILWDTEYVEKPGHEYHWDRELLNVARVYMIDGTPHLEVRFDKSVTVDTFDEYIASLPKGAKFNTYASANGSSYSYSYSSFTLNSKSADEIKKAIVKKFRYTVTAQYYYAIDNTMFETIKASDKATKLRLEKAKENYQKRLERKEAKQIREEEKARLFAETTTKELTIAQALKVLKKAGVTVKINGEM